MDHKIQKKTCTHKPSSAFSLSVILQEISGHGGGALPPPAHNPRKLKLQGVTSGAAPPALDTWSSSLSWLTAIILLVHKYTHIWYIYLKNIVHFLDNFFSAENVDISGLFAKLCGDGHPDFDMFVLTVTFLGSQTGHCLPQPNTSEQQLPELNAGNKQTADYYTRCNTDSSRERAYYPDEAFQHKEHYQIQIYC